MRCLLGGGSSSSKARGDLGECEDSVRTERDVLTLGLKGETWSDVISASDGNGILGVIFLVFSRDNMTGADPRFKDFEGVTLSLKVLT